MKPKCLSNSSHAPFICDYKVLARVLVQHFTPAAVDPGQTAFLPGRWIGDNVLQHLVRRLLTITAGRTASQAVSCF
jgi:hypothetical protein